MSDDLFRYVAGAMDDAAAERFEDALFEAWDPHTARLAALLDALARLGAAGPVVPIARRDELAALRARAKVVLYEPVDGTVRSRIGDEDFVAVRLVLGPAPAGSLDVVFCRPDGEAYFRVHQAPFDPETGELFVLCDAHRAIEIGHLRVRVLDRHDRVRAELAIENVS